MILRNDQALELFSLELDTEIWQIGLNNAELIKSVELPSYLLYQYFFMGAGIYAVDNNFCGRESN